jgi:hypothetical protein
MTFRIPMRGDQVSFFQPHFGRSYIALVRHLAITGDGEMAADLLVICDNGSAYGVPGVRYRDAAPDPRVAGMYFEFLDDDEDVS